MSDNVDQNTILNQVRRGTLLSGIALLAVYISAPASFACGGGPDPDSASDDPSSTTKKKPKTKKEKQSYSSIKNANMTISQNDFSKLSKSKIDSWHKSNIKLIIDGFSVEMSKNLFDMANNERKLTHKLLKDMAKLKTKSTRKEHLRREQYRVKKLIKELKKEKDSLPKTDAPKTEKLLSKIFKKKTRADEIDTRINSLIYYLGGAGHGVGGWSQSPMEGTLK